MRIKYCVLGVAALLLGSAAAQASTLATIYNNYDSSKVEVKSTVGSDSATADPKGGSAAVLSTWAGQSDPKHPYFSISVDGKPVCETRYNKRDVGDLTVMSDGTCQVGHVPYNPPTPTTKAPIINGIDENVNINTGQQYSVQGSITDPEGVTAEIKASVKQNSCSSWLRISLNGSGTDQVSITAKGVAPKSEGQCDFIIDADNGKGTAEKTSTIQYSSTPGPAPAASGQPPRSISVWIYDQEGAFTKDGVKKKDPGQYIADLNTWNKNAAAGNEINELYTYGADMEMYSGNDLEAYYTTPIKVLTKDAPNHYITKDNYNGPLNVALYKDQVKLKDVHAKIYMSPIVDGRFDTGYLTGFSGLSKDDVTAYADLVANQICTDTNVDGIQFDLEPAKLTEPNQVTFYNRLSVDFQAKTSSLPSCRTKNRYLSIFTFAQWLGNPSQSPELAKLLKQPNFEVVDSLYDVPGDSATATPAEYQKNVANEITTLMEVQKQAGFNVKFGLPASCSAHECGPNGNNIDYINAVLKELGAHNVCALNKKFKGIGLWTFDDAGKYQKPSADVMKAIQQNAASIIGCSLNESASH